MTVARHHAQSTLLYKVYKEVKQARVFQHNCNSLMYLLTYSIGLWGFDCNCRHFDIEDLQQVSKIKMSKLSPIVMNYMHWSGSLFKFHSKKVNRFLVNVDKFAQTGCSVNGDKCK